MTTPTLTLRSPTISPNPSQPATFLAPTPSQLDGVWHVTHSSLPLWKTKRNVTVTYRDLTPAAAVTTPPSLSRMDDTVTYQTLTSDKLKTIHGIDTAERDNPGVWNWRGTGWLKIASSHWEILGYGRTATADREQGEGGVNEEEGDERREWAVTYFAATVFSPAGIDIYSRERRALPDWVVEGVKGALAGLEDEGVRKLGEELFEVVMD